MARTRRRSPRPAASKTAAPRAAASQVRLPRIAKGKKPQYFSDPAIDKLLWMTLTLMEELSVARDRIDALERLLAARGVLELQHVEAYAPDGSAAAERSARRAAFVDRMMRAAQAELSAATAATDPHEEARRAVEG
ncbi:MAG: hypothetical protein ACKPBA_14445 [Planctomycetota bacterium]